MHKPLLSAVALAATLTLGGCASLGFGPPSAQSLAGVPVVNFGQPAPKNGDFILHFAAGQPIPTTVAIVGDLFRHSAKTTLTVALNRDLWAYKRWVSFDGTHWRDARDVLISKLEVRIPGTHHPAPGLIRFTLGTKGKAAHAGDE